MSEMINFEQSGAWPWGAGWKLPNLPGCDTREDQTDRSDLRLEKDRNRYASEGNRMSDPAARHPSSSSNVGHGAAASRIVRVKGMTYGYCDGPSPYDQRHLHSRRCAGGAPPLEPQRDERRQSGAADSKLK